MALARMDKWLSSAAAQVQGRCAAGTRVNWGRWDSLLVDLPSGYLGPDEQTGIVPSDIYQCAETKTAITTCRLIIVFGICKGIVLPGQQRKPSTNSIQDNGAGL